jgi:hypothetical protein
MPETHIFHRFLCFHPRLSSRVLGNSTHAGQIKCILLCTGVQDITYIFHKSPTIADLLVLPQVPETFAKNVLLRLKCILIEVSSPHLCLFRSTILIILRVPKQAKKPDSPTIRSVRPTNLKLV